jgi:hypothetical protein
LAKIREFKITQRIIFKFYLLCYSLTDKQLQQIDILVLAIYKRRYAIQGNEQRFHSTFIRRPFSGFIVAPSASSGIV